MNRIWLGLILAILAVPSLAQVTMTPAYSTYNSFRWDQATSLAYVTSYTQGTSYGSCNNPGGIGCASIVHSLSSYNYLKGPRGQTTNPYAYTQGPPFGMLFLNNTQTLLQYPQDGLANATIRVQATCNYAGYLQGWSFNLQLEVAYTVSKMRPTQVPPAGTCVTNLGVTHCQYDTMTWCTAATTPPDYNPTGVREVGPATYPTYWSEWALCERLGAGLAWMCVGVTPNGYSFPDNYPRQVCKKTP